MKKILTHISLSIGILLLSISAFVAPNALAQDATIVTLDLLVDSGCSWSGAPFAPTSSLTVADNEICVITGTGRQALNVTVEDDVDSLGQAGGYLIIGGSSATDTAFTVGGTFTANGLVEIGQTGDPNKKSSLTTNGVLQVSTVGSDGILSILSNTNEGNYIDVNNETMYVGTASTTGRFTNADNATSTIYALNLYGTFENLHASGVVSFDEPTKNVNIRSGFTFDNNGTVNVSNNITMYGSGNADNSGPINVATGDFYVGSTDVGTITFNNTGNITLITAAKWFSVGYGTDFTNTGTITTPQFMVSTGSTFDNNSGGVIDSDASGGIFAVYGDATYGDGVFNNNSGASVTTAATWILAGDLATGPAYIDSPTISNKSGATFAATSMTFGFADGGAGLGVTAYGGIFDNAGTLTVTGTGTRVELFQGGKFNNLAGGTTDITAGNMNLGTTDSRGDCESGTASMCTVTNASSTGLGFRMNSTTAVINMYGYSKIDNTGGTMTVCNATTCTTPTSLIIINANNTDIINGASATATSILNLNGDLILGYDAYLYNDYFDLTHYGTVNIKGISSATNLVLNTSAIFETKGTTNFIGTYQKVQLNNSSQLNVGSLGILVASTATGANSTLALNSSSSITNAGEITFKGGATLAGTSSITNSDSGNSAKFTVDDASTYANYLQIGSIAGDTPTVTNGVGATVTIDDETAGGDGQLRVYHGGSYANSGTTNTWYLFVGRHSTIDGGTLINSGTTGVVNVYSTSASAATPALDLYRGQITNTSTYVGTYGSFYVKGYFYMLGTGTGLDQATFTNSGAVYLISNAYVYNYSLLQLNTGAVSRWVLSTGTLNASGAVGALGQVNIDSGAAYSATTNIATYGTLTNAGTMSKILINGTSQGEISSITVSGTSSTLTNNNIINSTTFTVNTGGTVTNNSSLMASANFYAGNASGSNNILFTNSITGTLNAGYLAVWGSSTTDIFTNYGAVTVVGAGTLYHGYQTSYTGGIINNYGSFARGTGGSSIHNGATFNNYANATATFGQNTQVGYSGGAAVAYNQYAGTPGTTKSAFDGLIILGYGTFNNNDKITSNTLSISGTPGAPGILGKLYSNSGSTTQIGSSVSMMGIWTIASGATASVGTTISEVQSGGTPVPILTIDGTLTSAQSITVSTNSQLLSGNTSSITLTGSPSIQMDSTTPFVELAGTVNAHSIWATGGTLNNGYMCIGDYTGGACTHVGASAVNLTGVNANSIFAQTASGTSTIEMANDVTMAGGVMAKKRNTAGTTSKINVLKDAVITINGRNADFCQNVYSCAIAVGAYDAAIGAAEMNVYGTVDLSSATGRIIGLGYPTSTIGTGTLNIKSSAPLGHGLIYDYTNTQLIIARYVGKLNIERTSSSGFGELYLGNTCTISSTSLGTNGNQGANVNGKLSCYSNLTVSSTGSMDVGRMNDDTDRGEVYVNGSTTVINNFVELDGLLQTGTGDGDTLTVNSGGTITSGVGSATNFEIQGHDITINSGGKIASDSVSAVAPGSQGAGSYGGAGDGRSSSASYGASKLGMTDVPLYGQGGANSTPTVIANGGGGVRIFSTGEFINNGEISADGAATATASAGAGAGGTVIIVHEPLALDDEFKGNGALTANGGNSTQGTSGAGGGGRIVVISPLLDDPDDTCPGSPAPHPHYQFIGTTSAFGGTGTVNAGAAGTIVYLGDINNDDPATTAFGNWGTLIVNQGTRYMAAGLTTEIPDLGDTDFIRVEARNAAKITYEANPAINPMSCFQVDTSTIVGPTCNPYPDKPDLLYVSDSYTGAQQDGCTGPEPSTINPVDYLYDQTPVFSIVYNNPDDTDPVQLMAIQISENDPTFTTGLIWDTTLDLGATNTVTPGQRTRDIEFNEDSTATDTIIPGPTYYVRMAFIDSTNTGRGLWTHYDIGDHYNFEVLGNMTITDSCGSSMTIRDDNPNGTLTNIRDVDGDRYGNAECALTVTSDSAAWSIFLGKDSSSTAFEDVTEVHNIDPIDNAGADCTIQSDGGASAEEEYGFNITSAATLINNNIRTDGSCSQAYNAWNQGTGNYVFNVEDFGADNELVRVTSGGVTAGTAFTTNIHATVDGATAPEDYSLNLRASISTNP